MAFEPLNYSIKTDRPLQAGGDRSCFLPPKKGGRSFSVSIQPKLSVGSPDDSYEREADFVADRVMRMPAPRFVQRKCPECEKEKEGIQRKTSGDSTIPFLQTKSEGKSNVSPDISQSIASSRGNGSALDSITNSFMSSRFGIDFNNVSIHTDSRSIQLNRQLNARAFTVGNDVYFNQGEYNPNSWEGKHLLAHELTHVVQQGQNSIAPSIQRMLPCPSTLAAEDPVPDGFKPYYGNPNWFHCGYRGILEDRVPSPEDPQNECFYDTLGRLVDENHPNAACRGTPNDYDSSSSWWDHTFNDRGGIWQRGWGAFWGSRFSKEDQDFRDAQEACVIRLGGCPHSRPGGIPSPEEIEQYNERCRGESNYQGPMITPECN